MLLPLKKLNACTNRYNKEILGAIEEVDDQEVEIKSKDKRTNTDISDEAPKGIIYGNEDNLLKRRKAIKNADLEPADFAYERSIGENDAVYSNFVELLVDAKKKVGRIIIKDSRETKGYATGFMVTDNLLLTNWHVFETKEEVLDSEIEFDYEFDVHGNFKDSIIFKLDANEFYLSSEELDYCFVAVEKVDESGSFNLSSFGSLSLRSLPGKLGDTGKERLNIIHHPNGEHKQLSIRENTFTKVMSQSIWYESDTAPGSSGSPVLNDQMELVALHHMGVANRDAFGNYLDKNDQIIVPVGGKVDASRIKWIANEGIRISVILKDLENKNNSPYVAELLNAASGDDDISETNNIEKPSERPINLSDKNQLQMSKDSIQVLLPSSALDKSGNININITTDRVLQHSSSTAIPANDSASELDALALERRRIEDSISYDDCEGYQVDFLGRNREVLIPGPFEATANNMAAVRGTDNIVLDYHLYSVIFDKTTRMTAISAINIDGNEDLRLDRTPRRDRWIRDNRFDYDVQLDSKFYLRSGFDKGHMSRREDANWGSDAALAKRNADLTCVYTNACPQVPGLNRFGVWNKLEKQILEKALSKRKAERVKLVFSMGHFSS